MRLTIADFNTLRLTHCWSEPDDAVQAELLAAGYDAQSGGYTEWFDMRDGNCVSVGWSWYINGDGDFGMAPWNFGTNLMLLGRRGEALGRSITDDFLRSRMLVSGWRHTVRMSLMAPRF